MGKEKIEKKIDFDSIGITNDFLFGSVMSEPENCKEFLQRILGVEIVELAITESQKSMKQGFYSKGVRLDVYAKDTDGNAYDIEMQQVDTKELDLRSRYYHSEMDGHQISSGCKYKDLKQSIVIFVCCFDMFDKDRSLYTFETICEEDTSIHLQDKRQTIFVNIGGKRDGYGEDLIHLLDYFETGKSTDSYTQKLSKRVKILREDAEWRQVYMTWEMKLDERYDAGLREGRESGLREGREDGLREGRENGLREGRDEGRKAELGRQIQRKLQKGKSISQIADECEESEDVIREMIEMENERGGYGH